ncbi:MAG: bifunctional phosphopantothenoylcysteine decarboxylase/phosphopantothenate--cysteine ligase CoaBC [Ginsengibacter sp.]|jgi:phosphopantothenoylcysteine decarboxylase/phosphopantothenate--cysteine ligase
MLTGKKIVIGVTGSIAAYKAVSLVRLLIQNGAEVKVLMTKGATDFVTTLTFATLSKHKVSVDLFEEDTWANHVELGRWADVMVIAPATANTLAKMAHGICDNLLQATYLSAVCPVIIAPAMDEEMWHHSATKNNVKQLQEWNHHIIQVNKGELASGLFGEGRMAEPEEIVQYLTEFFEKKNTLQGKKVLITAGPTYENIDPVRFIGNHSSGKMGIALAEEMLSRGAEVKLILGPSQEKVNGNVNTVRITSAEEMYQATMMDFEKFDFIIMAAAVADYTPAKKELQKIKKTEDSLQIDLIKTKDILMAAGQKKSSHQILVGFALETQNEKEFALEKLHKKNADYIVLNSLKEDSAGFGYATNKITIFEKDGQAYEFPLKTKKEVAVDIINLITRNENI